MEPGLLFHAESHLACKVKWVSGLPDHPSLPVYATSVSLLPFPPKRGQNLFRPEALTLPGRPVSLGSLDGEQCQQTLCC